MSSDHGDMSVLIVLSQRDDEGLICCYDKNRTIAKEWILKQFNNEYCPTLHGKPKLFIFQTSE